MCLVSIHSFISMVCKIYQIFVHYEIRTHNHMVIFSGNLVGVKGSQQVVLCLQDYEWKFLEKNQCDLYYHTIGAILLENLDKFFYGVWSL